MKTRRELKFRGDLTLSNIENGAGEYSLQQKYEVESIDYGAKANGIGSVAFGGKRYDKLTDTTRTETIVNGNQAFVAGGSVIVETDFSAGFGKDNKIAKRKAALVFGGGNELLGKKGLDGQEEGANATYSFSLIGGESNIIRNDRASIVIGDSNYVGADDEKFLDDHFSWNNAVFGHHNGTEVAPIEGNGNLISGGNNLNYWNSYSFVYGQGNTNTAHYAAVGGRNNTNHSIASIVIGEGLLNGGEHNAMFGVENENNAKRVLMTGKHNKNRADENGGSNSIIGGYCNINYGHHTTMNGDHNENHNSSVNMSGMYNVNKSNSVIMGGEYNYNEGWCAVVGGYRTINRNHFAGIFGLWNDNKTDTLLEVGNGAGEASRSNAFEIYKDGRAKVYKAPENPEDVVRKKELDDVAESFETRVGANEEYIAGLKDGSQQPKYSKTILTQTLEERAELGLTFMLPFDTAKNALWMIPCRIKFNGVSGALYFSHTVFIYISNLDNRTYYSTLIKNDKDYEGRITYNPKTGELYLNPKYTTSTDKILSYSIDGVFKIADCVLKTVDETYNFDTGEYIGGSGSGNGGGGGGDLGGGTVVQPYSL